MGTELAALHRDHHVSLPPWHAAGALRAEAYIDRTEGVKTFAKGHISDGDGITVEAEGIFITPAWARDAG